MWRPLLLDIVQDILALNFGAPAVEVARISNACLLLNLFSIQHGSTHVTPAFGEQENLMESVRPECECTTQSGATTSESCRLPHF